MALSQNIKHSCAPPSALGLSQWDLTRRPVRVPPTPPFLSRPLWRTACTGWMSSDRGGQRASTQRPRCRNLWRDGRPGNRENRSSRELSGRQETWSQPAEDTPAALWLSSEPLLSSAIHAVHQWAFLSGKPWPLAY